MIQLLFVFLYFSHLVLGTSADATSSDCPPPDATTRSVWSILGNCGLTLLICVWHSIHFDVPKPGEEWRETLREKCMGVLASFFAPEIVVGMAVGEWWKARRKVIRYRGVSFQ